MKYFIICTGISLLLLSCTEHKTEKNLTTREINFIRELIPLDNAENILIFESNGGFDGIKQSGNFMTESRVIAYWIENGKKEIHSARFLDEVDSIATTDLISKPTYASYATVFKHDGTTFKVYVDADSARTYQFFNRLQIQFAREHLIR